MAGPAMLEVFEGLGVFVRLQMRSLDYGNSDSLSCRVCGVDRCRWKLVGSAKTCGSVVADGLDRRVAAIGSGDRAADAGPGARRFATQCR